MDLWRQERHSPHFFMLDLQIQCFLLLEMGLVVPRAATKPFALKNSSLKIQILSSLKEGRKTFSSTYQLFALPVSFHLLKNIMNWGFLSPFYRPKN
jgi:hypothetical protein